MGECLFLIMSVNVNFLKPHKQLNIKVALENKMLKTSVSILPDEYTKNLSVLSDALSYILIANRKR